MNKVYETGCSLIRVYGRQKHYPTSLPELRHLLPGCDNHIHRLTRDRAAYLLRAARSRR